MTRGVGDRVARATILPLVALEPTPNVDEASFAEVAGREVSELTSEDLLVELLRGSCRCGEPGRS